MSRRHDTVKIEIPEYVVDPQTKIRYKKGKFLGRGGFAKCFELINTTSNEIFAGKVISKSQLQKPEQKDKMTQEISIHRSVKHNNIVGFHTYFEDKENIYIILEICNKRSLMEMHKRRRQLTEAEVRYFVKQIAEACYYLHRNRVVHRDLKLGNLFLNDNMELKVGDFGLATKIRTEGERKLTLCGTPNYIAPEVLSKKGHSYEVDVWSLGCIVYTLIVGKPPFETNDLKDTYKRIKSNEYSIPSSVPNDVKNFINKMLQSDPKLRPSMDDILKDSYMEKNYIPSRLPHSCLTTAPRFNNGRLSIIPPPDFSSPRRPLGEMGNAKTATAAAKHEIETNLQNGPVTRSQQVAIEVPKDFNLRELSSQLHRLLKSKPSERQTILEDEAEDPAGTPVYWISKWVDYTDKYGLGYQLCDNSVGVLFNDITRIVLFPDEQNLQYIDRDGTEMFYTFNKCPSLQKKVTLLTYFRNYMNEHLVKTGEKGREGNELVRLPYLHNWFRTRNAIVFQLTNGTVQVNFFQDHTKLILCPLMGGVTYINEKRTFQTFKFDLIEKYGCGKELEMRLKYAREVVDRLMTHKLTSNAKSKN